MVSLLILKQVRNLSDESVVEQWAENSYYQYFSGEIFFVQTTHVFQLNWWSSPNVLEQKGWS
ncbi:MAG: transposase [Bacteroidetes bacterium]|nr:transposase [Bacteroidota bacterium]